MWPLNSNWKRLLVILAPLWPENTNILSLHTATGKLQQDGGISPLWSICWAQNPKRKEQINKSFWQFYFNRFMNLTGLFPACMFSILQTDGPHVIQPEHKWKTLIRSDSAQKSIYRGYQKRTWSNIPGIPIIASKYPQLVVVDCSSMSRSGHWQAETITGLINDKSSLIAKWNAWNKR